VLKYSFLFALTVILVSCGCNCEEKDQRIAELEDSLYLAKMWTPVPVDLPEPKTEVFTNQDAVSVSVTANDTYYFNEGGDQYSFPEMTDSLSARMDRSGSNKLKINGDKDSRYELVFDLITLAKENDWSPILVHK